MKLPAIALAGLLALPHLQIGEADAAGRAGILAHRAVYDLSLLEASERSGISGVRGRLVQEVDRIGCEGFTVNYQIVTEYRNREGKAHVSDIRATSWESADGSSFRFSTRQFLNKSLSEETMGRASRGAEGKSGTGVLSKPSEEQFDLAPEVIFPTEHTSRILDAALEGEQFERSLVYDGTNGKKVFRAVTFVGKERKPGEAASDFKGAEVLQNLRSWPVTVSFFEETDNPAGEQTPSHEIRFIMFENAVSRDLVLDYGDFSVRGELKDLAAFEREACKD